MPSLKHLQYQDSDPIYFSVLYRTPNNINTVSFLSPFPVKAAGPLYMLNSNVTWPPQAAMLYSSCRGWSVSLKPNVNIHMNGYETSSSEQPV